MPFSRNFIHSSISKNDSFNYEIIFVKGIKIYVKMTHGFTASLLHLRTAINFIWGKFLAQLHTLSTST